MSRLDEVEAVIAESYRSRYLPPLEEFARTIAAEVDELRGKLAEYESECYALRAVTAEKNSDILRKRVKARDVVITKLLAMLKPAAGDTECPAYTLHARACEIAGRTE